MSNLLATSTDAVARMLPWLAGVVGLIIVGGVVMLMVRRLIHPGRQQPSDGFSLQELRDLHASGGLTDEQYERARSLIIGHPQRTSASPDDTGSRRRGGAGTP